MKTRTRTALLISALFIFLMATGATESSCHNEGSKSDRADKKQVDQQQLIYQNGQPVPMFQFSRERDTAIQLYEARNQTVATWTVWRSDFGKVLGHCASVGFPLPYDTSLTNPLKTANEYRDSSVIEQAEPNGLYSSKNSIATWVLCVKQFGGETVVAPVYVEDKVNVYPWPVIVNYETDRVIDAADAAATIQITQESKGATP